MKRAKRLYLLSVVLTSLACGVDQDVLVRANATPGTAGATSATAGHAGGAAGPSAGGTAGATGGAGASAGGSLGGGGALGTGGASAGAPVFSPPFAAGSTVTAGQSHTCALWAGVTWCWGENSRGEVGVGDLVPRLTPARLDGLPPLASISAGDHLSVARRAADGRVYAWGANSSGQLGTSDFSDRSAPSLIAGLASTGLVVAGYAHACALDTFARLRCWGENGEGQLGQDDVYPGTNAASPLPVAGSDWRAVSAGQGHTCALRASGELWCWGRNSGGQLALGAGSAVQVRVPTVAATAGDLRTLEGGQGSTCAVASDHAVRCWGDVPVAAVGAPAPTPLTSPTTVADSGREVSVDTFHVCMIELDGSLWCWGRNAEGQLGLGDELDRAAPVRIDGAVDWSHVAVGRFHTCAQKLDGTMWCTGDNFGGQLGVGDTQRRKLFTQVILP